MLNTDKPNKIKSAVRLQARADLKPTTPIEKCKTKSSSRRSLQKCNNYIKNILLYIFEESIAEILTDDDLGLNQSAPDRTASVAIK